MSALGVIPARYQSSRFPGKPLVSIAGIPMIVRVAERVAVALGKDRTVIATDDDRIATVAADHGFRSVMTSSTAATGTDRVAEVARQIPADLYLNIQGDEPLILPSDITKVVAAKSQYPNCVVNAMSPLSPTEDASDPTIPKVVFNKDRELIYMSRAPIPGVKSVEQGPPLRWKQVCIYAFSLDELAAFASSPGKSALERFEDIEILRFFDLGIRVKMVEAEGRSIAVDIPEHVKLVEEQLAKVSHD